MSKEVIYIATRGSALALAQSNLVKAQCEEFFPEERFELKVIKTTGDKLQAVNPADPNQEFAKGLFTKELELALLDGTADFAVHSLKDLPTDLPEGLHLGGVSAREDVRDVLIYRGAGNAGRSYPAGTSLKGFAQGAVIGTSSTRRQAQVTDLRPDLTTRAIRGNVGTRIRKMWEAADVDAIVLAYAGLKRLGYRIAEDGELIGADVPTGTLASVLSLEEMLPCVGQAALGYECRAADKEINSIVQKLNDAPTLYAVTAERAFLRAMGGGCLSPVAAHAELKGSALTLRVVSFQEEKARRTEQKGSEKDADLIGKRAAEAVR
jgi:hydroxymethylbilane synthase